MLTCAHSDASSHSFRYSHCDMSSLLQVGRGYVSEVVTGKDSGGSPNAAPIYVMPYVMGDNQKGVLIVNMKAAWQQVEIVGVTDGIATVVEVATDGPNAAEPGFAPQVAKQIGADGILNLGPFAVAVVTDLE